MSGRYTTFIAANRAFWSRLSGGSPSRGLLLVEPQTHPIIAHANGVFARVLKEAKGLGIRWIDTGDADIQDRMRSYDATSQTLSTSGAGVLDAIGAAVTFAVHAVSLVATGRVLDVSLDGVRLGDILYDSYLARFQVATLRRVNLDLLKTLWTLIVNYRTYSRLIRRHAPSAVLVSHNIGLVSGVLVRAALRRGVPVYHQRGGVQAAALIMYTPQSGWHEYAYRPRAADLDHLSALGRPRLEREFEAVMTQRMRERTDKDAVNAYGLGKTVLRDREAFARDHALPVGRPFVFVMLHAFNDHPHSHFGRMLFKDYYQWFAQTLAYARSNTRVNWVFKEHPSAAMYPTRDIELAAHFADRPPHVLFLDRHASFSSESLRYLAHAVVTVAGTAGVEFPAFASVPCVMAGESSYSGFGFTIEPETAGAYWRTLDRIDTLPRLSEEQTFTARTIFLYAGRYAFVRYSWSPPIGLEAERDPGLDAQYWDLVAARYAQRTEALVSEFRQYVACVGQPDFSRLAALDYPELLTAAAMTHDQNKQVSADGR